MAYEQRKTEKEDAKKALQKIKRQEKMQQQFGQKLADAETQQARDELIKNRKKQEENRAKKEERKATKGEPNSAWKIKVYPTKDQQKILNRLFGTVRWIYNKSVDYINDHSEENMTSTERTQRIRGHCVNEDSTLVVNNPWVKEVHSDIRDDARKHACEALVSNLAKCAKRKADGGPSHHFKLKHRTKKCKSETISIRAKHWSVKRGVLYDLFGTAFEKMKGPQGLVRYKQKRHPTADILNLPEHLEHDARLIHDRYLNQYYLCLPMQGEIAGDNQAPDKNLHSTASLDPGVRTFMTVYSADGEVVEWGTQQPGAEGGDTSQIYKLCRVLDKLQSKMSQPHIRHKQRYNMKRVSAKIRKRIRSIVNEVHYKLSKWLCTNFRTILIPKFDTQRMVRRGHRRINSTTARNMCTWAHYRFRQLLLSKAQRYPWVKVIVTTEEYTSKTCGHCGEINSKLGGNKNFVCKSCGYEADRDFNGARNILLKYLSKEIKLDI